MGRPEACKAFRTQTCTAVSLFGMDPARPSRAFSFMVHLEKEDPVHLFDSDNLEIVLTHLDTITDFTEYLTAKEATITKYDAFSYCGEEDLLAHYLYNYDKKRREHIIGPKDKTEPINGVMIGEGEWKDFVGSDIYARRREADRPSYLWDEIIQRTCQNALEGTLLGHPLFEGQSAIHEMAKEPRFIRRALSERIIEAIRTFPSTFPGSHVSSHICPPFSETKATCFCSLRIRTRPILRPNGGQSANRYLKSRAVPRSLTFLTFVQLWESRSISQSFQASQRKTLS